MSNLLNGITTKLFGRAVPVYAWPVVQLGYDAKSGKTVPISVDAAGAVTGGGSTEWTATAGVIASGSDAQVAVPANPARKKLAVQVLSDAAESVFVRFDAVAGVGSPSWEIQPGSSQAFPAPCDTRALSIIAATTGTQYTIWEA